MQTPKDLNKAPPSRMKTVSPEQHILELVNYFRHRRHHHHNPNFLLSIHHLLLLLLVIQATALSATGAPSALDSEDIRAEDPDDDASIERLSRSCLTVHASSARPEQLNVTFLLFTKNNPHVPYHIRPQVTRLELTKNSPFDPDKSIKWITHGFHTNVDKSEWMLEAKDKILAFEDANVILTDWRRGAWPALSFYPRAAANAHVVAKMIVKILRRLRNDIDLSRTHLIGHSLGAHIMGFVGSAFTEEYVLQQQQKLHVFSQDQNQSPIGWLDSAAQQAASSGKLIGRITACDPALPCFGPSSSTPSSGVALPLSPTINLQQAMITTTQSTVNVYGRAGQPTEYNSLPPGPNIGGVINGNRDPDSSLDNNNTYLDLSSATNTMWTHLRPDSAVVVEVMHSNPGVMGYADPLGDFDFYPNGFERQPGCGSTNQPDASTTTVVAAAEPARDSAHASVDATSYRQGRVKGSGEGDGEIGSDTIRSRRQLMNGYMDTVVKSVASRVWSRGGDKPTGRARSSNSTSGESGGGSGGLSLALDRFIKPIKNFFHSYTCSHHRAVEYMVESMYYEQVPQDRRLDRDFVCQMVGYRCANYQSFKRGFCFRCSDEHDCRSFTMFRNLPGQTNSPAASFSSSLGRSLLSGQAPTGVANHAAGVGEGGGLEKFKLKLGSLNSSFSTVGPSEAAQQQQRRFNSNTNAGNNLRQLAKRVLPTIKHYSQHYRPSTKNQYYFDTRPTREFCLHHYHLYVKYRWFRVRDSVLVDGLRLIGTLGSITKDLGQAQLNRYTHQSYTMLLTERAFLGQVEALLVLGDQIKPTLVEYIEVTYMSNLDARVRALGSARLCRSHEPQQPPPPPSQPVATAQPSMGLDNNRASSSGMGRSAPTAAIFLRCAGPLV